MRLLNTWRAERAPPEERAYNRRRSRQRCPPLAEVPRRRRAQKAARISPAPHASSAGWRPRAPRGVARVLLTTRAPGALGTHHQSPPTCAGHSSSRSSSSPRREGEGGSIVSARFEPAAGRGAVEAAGSRPGRAGAGASAGAQGRRGAGGERSAGGGRGAHPGRAEGAAEAENRRGSQSLCLLQRPLGRRNQSRGRAGAGARGGTGEEVRGGPLRQSGGGTRGREPPCAPGRRAGARSRGGARARWAGGCGDPPASPPTPSPWEHPPTPPTPPGVVGVRGEGGEGVSTGWR